MMVLQHLSATQPTSGEHLASRFGCSRAAINKQIARYRELGVLIEARPHEGYRFGYAYEWWQDRLLMTELEALGVSTDVHVLQDVNSTNTWGMSALQTSCAPSLLVVSDFQHQGRGRRGRQWFTPAGRQITVSWGLHSEAAPVSWMGVALAIGVAVASVLRLHGVPVQLKWPNDLVIGHAKLGGLLVEMEAMLEGASRIVVGLGLNEHLLEAEVEMLDREVAMLSNYPRQVTRHALLAQITHAVFQVLADYPSQGLRPYQDAWRELDALAQRHVRFQQGDVWLSGVAQGIDDAGRLRVETPEGVVACHSGEVSVHAA